MKVTSDACLFGAWVGQSVSEQFINQQSGSWHPIAIGSVSSQSISSQPYRKNILDIGTGTGLLSLMMAQQCDAAIDAVEIDRAAFEQAKENAWQSPWKERINVIHADVKDFHPSAKYDVIVSNPPFYENELKSASSQKNIAHHSDELSLDSLLSFIHQHLDEKGWFYLLLPYKRKEEAEKRLLQHLLFVHEMVEVRQSARHGFFRLMIRGGLQTCDHPSHSTIAIQDEQQQYTPAFTELLKDYYLYL